MHLIFLVLLMEKMVDLLVVEVVVEDQDSPLDREEQEEVAMDEVMEEMLCREQEVEVEEHNHIYQVEMGVLV